ncbi:hypothetical protein [Runella limosa]|uniref:hypothetical protein n=1 Tax=Runella limosa TaxID=370978 RepID=UPI0004136E27|nr:hypothetical protein [Runella limosa]
MATYGDFVPDWGTGKSMMGGLQEIAYICSVADIATFKVPATNPTNPEDKYAIVEPHVCKTGKKFSKIYVSKEKGSLEYKHLGNLDGGGWEITAQVFIPGDSKKQTYMANETQFDRFIALLPDKEGIINQVGTETNPAVLQVDYSTQVVTGDGKGYMGKIVSYQPWKYIYDAAVPLTPAT